MMKKPDIILDEIHITRCKLYDATKDMTASERTEFFKQTGEAVAEKYGFHRISSARKTESDLERISFNQ